MTRARVWKPHHRFVRIMQGTDNQHNKKESEEHRLRFDASTRRHANQAMFPTAQLVWRVRVRDLHDGARVGASRGRTVRPRRRLGVMGFRIFAAAALRDAAERRPARHLNAPAAAVAEAWTTERLSRLGPDISSPPLVFMVTGHRAWRGGAGGSALSSSTLSSVVRRGDRVFGWPVGDVGCLATGYRRCLWLGISPTLWLRSYRSQLFLLDDRTLRKLFLEANGKCQVVVGSKGICG